MDDQFFFICFVRRDTQKIKQAMGKIVVVGRYIFSDQHQSFFKKTCFSLNWLEKLDDHFLELLYSCMGFSI